jgi:hypothetical protein
MESQLQAELHFSRQMVNNVLLVPQGVMLTQQFGIVVHGVIHKNFVRKF